MESLWSQSCSIGQRPCLQGDTETEIAVIGAGMAGILTACQLQKAGKQVLVLEADRIAGGQTKNTTAKITSQHGLIYHELIKKLGEAGAEQYAQANETAIREYRKLIAEEDISCNFEEKASFVYSKVNLHLQEEADAAMRLGLPASLVQEELPLPFPVHGAVKFSNQAQLHPLKFIKAVSEKLSVYENTSVQKVDSQMIITNRGKVKADKIIFACHYPFLKLPGMYLLRMRQNRSYVLALENAGQVNGMYIGDSKSGYSLRNYGPYLLFGGEGHRTGKNTDRQNYENLRKEAGKFFPGSREICCWSAQDCITPDKMPYIGQYSKSRPNWYIATGFQKWGMSFSMAAAMLLRDLICEKENPCAEIFSPQRFSGENIPFIVKEGGQSIKGLSKHLLPPPSKTPKDLAPGEGGVVMLHHKKAGVYKDENGKLYAVDIHCPHLGCHLEWNPADRSWDCPCHGSRFDYKGNLISGPAQKNLKQIFLSED